MMEAPAEVIRAAGSGGADLTIHVPSVLTARIYQWLEDGELYDAPDYTCDANSIFALPLEVPTHGPDRMRAAVWTPGGVESSGSEPVSRLTVRLHHPAWRSSTRATSVGLWDLGPAWTAHALAQWRRTGGRDDVSVRLVGIDARGRIDRVGPVLVFHPPKP